MGANPPCQEASFLAQEISQTNIKHRPGQGPRISKPGKACQRESGDPGDDLRKIDPKFKQPRLDQYLAAVKLLEQFARERFARQVLHLAVRWVLDHGADIALWGGRRPEQMDPVPEISGCRLDQAAFQAIDRIIQETIKDPVGPEFMAPPSRDRMPR